MNRPLLTRTLILTIGLIAVGLLGGLTGAFLANSTLEEYLRSLQTQVVVREITDPKPPSVPASAHEAIAVVKERTQMNSVVVVDSYDRIHAQGVVTSRGVAAATALTTDGWFMLPKTVSNPERYQLIVEGEVADIEEVILDPLTEMAFVKTEVSEARVGTFGNAALVATGDLVYVVDRNRVVPRTILEAWYVDEEGALQSSDTLERTFLLDQPTVALPGALVTDGSGALLGILVNDTEVRPLHQLTGAFESVLLEGEVVRSTLGVAYYDTSRMLIDGVREGLVVRSVARGSAAEEAGLVIGDIILRAEGVAVGERPFSEVVSSISTGSELTLSVERTGESEPLEISVTL